MVCSSTPVTGKLGLHSPAGQSPGHTSRRQPYTAGVEHPDGNQLKFVMRSELGNGPLALLKLQGFRLPDTIFNAVAGAEERQ